MHYKSINNKLNSIRDRLNISNKARHIIIASLNDNNNGYKWIIKDNCNINQVSHTKIVYVNDYKEYIDKLNDKSVVIIDDLDLCS